MVYPISGSDRTSRYITRPNAPYRGTAGLDQHKPVVLRFLSAQIRETVVQHDVDTYRQERRRNYEAQVGAAQAELQQETARFKQLGATAQLFKDEQWRANTPYRFRDFGEKYHTTRFKLGSVLFVMQNLYSRLMSLHLGSGRV